MLSLIRFLILSIFMVGAIASCQSQTNNETFTSNQTDCRTIEHEAGETEVCSQPQRIVVLGPYVLEPLLTLGVQPVAYGDHVAFHQGEYDNPKAQIPYLGEMINQPIANVGIAYEPSIEAIAKVQPDLIIGLEANTKQYDILSQIAPTILLEYANPQKSLKAIALAVDRTSKVKELLAEIEQRIAEAREAFKPVVADHPQLLLLYSEQLEQLIPSTPNEMCHSLPEELGFKMVSLPESKIPKPNSPSIPISIEKLPELNDADSVIVLGYNFDKQQDFNQFNNNQTSKIKQAWKDNAITQSLDASKAGQIYFIPSYLCLGLPGAIGTELYLEELEQQLLPPE